MTFGGGYNFRRQVEITRAQESHLEGLRPYQKNISLYPVIDQ